MADGSKVRDHVLDVASIEVLEAADPDFLERRRPATAYFEEKGQVFPVAETIAGWLGTGSLECASRIYAQPSHFSPPMLHPWHNALVCKASRRQTAIDKETSPSWRQRLTPDSHSHGAGAELTPATWRDPKRYAWLLGIVVLACAVHRLGQRRGNGFRLLLVLLRPPSHLRRLSIA